MDYIIYVVDIESNGLNYIDSDIIELSLYRMSNDSQKTWCIKPPLKSVTDPNSLRINGHKLEDILHQTKYGKETYQDPGKVLVEIENWIAEDDVTASQRCLAGQNISFDKIFLEQFWSKNNAADSFPFGRKTIDTLSNEFFMDLCKGQMAEGYSLKNLTKKYGIVNSKAHSAAADTLATKEVLLKQIDFFKKALSR